MAKNKSNDKYLGFQDELVLAELIQNAAARGLTSVRGRLFGKLTADHTSSSGIPCKQTENSIVKVKGAVLKNPPKGADCACALGAMALTPKLTKPLTIYAMHGNDRFDGDYLSGREDFDDDSPEFETTVYGDERSMQIGLAYEQALRPEVVNVQG